MDKIIEVLAQYFSPKFKEKLIRCENLEKLIKKLDKKQRQLQQDLENSSDSSKQESIKTKLAVLTIQKEKAIALLKDN